MENQNFTEEQKQYLEGFFQALSQRGTPYVGETAEGLITNDTGSGGKNQAEAPQEEETWYGIPVDDLCKEEQVKMAHDPFDMWENILEHARENKFPEGGDVLRYKFNGLFYVSPAQEAFMLRVRTPGNVMRSDQMHGLAEIADDWAGGYGHVTTRGNMQLRELPPKHVPDTLMKLQELGIIHKGSGADNVRNITATPTSGFDPEEIYDVRPMAKAMQHYIINQKDLFGLPRKFNIAFDSGGQISVVADTNDIGFMAVKVGEGQEVEPGVYFRVKLAGITGHKQFAMDSGLLLKPEECVPFAAALLKVYAANGDRTNRKKARMKYLIDDWGVQSFLDEIEKKLDFDLRYFPETIGEPRPPIVKHGHIGIYPQKQDGLYYIGIALPVGHMSSKQMHQVADLAQKYGAGELRLTAWQNVILPDVKEKNLEKVKQAILDIGFHYQTTSVSAGLVACTGNTGCKFSATNTKGQATKIAEHLNSKVTLDKPVNIHLTGCPNSCAQHYIGDIGLLGNMVTAEDGEKVEGYNIVIGGGCDNEQGIARDIYKSIPFEQVPELLEKMINTYNNNCKEGESFADFTRRYEIEELRSKIET